MSHGCGYHADMKTRLFVRTPPPQRLIASFGQARLYADWEGRYELRGGTAQDRTEAKEWISLFMHEAVPHCVTAN